MTGALHPGAVLLLHAVSATNIEILPEVIDYAEEQGYAFKSADYPAWAGAESTSDSAKAESGHGREHSVTD